MVKPLNFTQAFLQEKTSNFTQTFLVKRTLNFTCSPSFKRSLISGVMVDVFISVVYILLLSYFSCCLFSSLLLLSLGSDICKRMSDFADNPCPREICKMKKMIKSSPVLLCKTCNRWCHAHCANIHAVQAPKLKCFVCPACKKA